MPNLYFAIRERKKHLEKLRRSPEYRAKQAIFLAANPYCAVYAEVGRKVKATLIHHVYKWSYKTDEMYMDFFNNGAEPVSFKGHYARHNYLRVCPVCKDKMTDYASTMCKACWMKAHPALARLEKQAAIKKKQDKALEAKKQKIAQKEKLAPLMEAKKKKEKAFRKKVKELKNAKKMPQM